MLAFLFVLLAVAVRFLPHPWHFTPVAACLLFFGARGPRKWLWLPVLALPVSDLLLDKFVYAYPFTWDLLITWAWYAAMLWLGTKLTRHQKPLPLIGAALSASVSFFLLSNFGVWAATAMYPKTLSGLMSCYAVGIPFFRHTAEGDLVFTLAMFATPVLISFLSEAFEGSNPAAAA